MCWAGEGRRVASAGSSCSRQVLLAIAAPKHDTMLCLLSNNKGSLGSVCAHIAGKDQVAKAMKGEKAGGYVKHPNGM